MTHPHRLHTIRRADEWAERALRAEGWEAVVADLAEKHADELEVRVAELRVLARKLRAPNGEPW